MPGGDWNSFKTIGEETGRIRQSATWAHYVGALLFWPVALPYAVLELKKFLTRRILSRHLPYYEYPRLPEELWDVRYLALHGIGLIVGIGICIRMFVQGRKDRKALAHRATMADKADANGGETPQVDQPSGRTSGADTTDPSERSNR